MAYLPDLGIGYLVIPGSYHYRSDKFVIAVWAPKILRCSIARPSFDLVAISKEKALNTANLHLVKPCSLFLENL